MVDQSLLRQAADRGVTICFADLDGADGLWVPEERTVLVNRGLSEAKVAEVIEHELAHVMIDDQHADLDAGKEVLVGRPPARYRRPQTVALAAVSLFVVVGGATYGINAARDGGKFDRVAPNPDGTGLTAQESGDPKPTVIPSRAPNGEIVYITVTPTAPTPITTGSPLDLPTLTPTATRLVAPPTAARTTGGAPPGQQTTSPAPPPPVQPTTDPPQTTPTTEPTTPVVQTPPDQTAGAGEQTGDQGGAGGTGTDPVGGGIGPGPVQSQPADATVGNVSAPDTGGAAIP